MSTELNSPADALARIIRCFHRECLVEEHKPMIHQGLCRRKGRSCGSSLFRVGRVGGRGDGLSIRAFRDRRWATGLSAVRAVSEPLAVTRTDRTLSASRRSSSPPRPAPPQLVARRHRRSNAGRTRNRSCSTCCPHGLAIQVNSFMTPVLSPWRSTLIPEPFKSVSHALQSGVPLGSTRFCPNLIPDPPPASKVGQFSSVCD